MRISPPDMGAGRRTRRTTQRVTMNEVAAAAGVSPSTVSLYFRRPDAVSPDRTERVRIAIEQLGYVPNLAAGSLAAAGSRTVGVNIPSIINSFFAETYNTLQSLFQGAEHQTLLGVSDFNPEQEERLIRALLAWSPAAMVVIGFEHTAQARRLLLSCGVPVVEMWDTPQAGVQAIDMSVGFSHQEVGRLQTRHLYDQGCRQVAYIGAAVEQDTRVRSRGAGYAQEASRCGRHPPVAVTTPDPATPPTGCRLFSEVLNSHPDIDGIVCSNDMLALGILFEAQRRNIRVPEDLSVVGFGDLSFSGSSLPPLTTVRPPQTEIGGYVARQIMERLRGGDISSPHVELRCELVMRGSTRGLDSAQSSSGC